MKARVYYQPKFDDKGDIDGHPGEYCFSFEVWLKKEALLKDYPNCTPIEYSGDDIESPVFIDKNPLPSREEILSKRAELKKQLQELDEQLERGIYSGGES